MAEQTTPVNGNGNGYQRWQNLSAFMMKLNSKQFYVTMLLVVYCGFNLWIGTHLPAGVTMEAFLSLISIVNGFLLPVVVFWFQQDQKQRDAKNQTAKSPAD